MTVVVGRPTEVEGTFKRYSLSEVVSHEVSGAGIPLTNLQL